MRNSDRELTLKAFAYLYAPEDLDDIIRRMPTQNVDPEGEMFDEYFGMLQTVANAAQDKSILPQEMEVLEAKMSLLAHKYGYPHKVVLNVGANHDV